jgi:hypothetical protein
MFEHFTGKDMPSLRIRMRRASGDPPLVKALGGQGGLDPDIGVSALRLGPDPEG